MSFILDALRKAEHRNRDQHKLSVPAGPTVLMDETPDAPTNWRNVVLVSIVGIALLAAGIVFGLRDNDAPESVNTMVAVPQTPAMTTGQETAAQIEPEKRNQPTFNSPPAPPRDTGARSLDREVLRTQTRSEPRGAPSAPVSVPRTAQAGSEPPVVKTTPRVRTETLPDYAEVVQSGQVALPQLHLDMHVYSARPEKRFVFINLDKFRQGESIDSGTVIEAIDADGVVIDHKGFRFILKPD